MTEEKNISLKERIVEERGIPQLKFKKSSGKPFIIVAMVLALLMIIFFSVFAYNKYKKTISTNVEEAFQLKEESNTKTSNNLLAEQRAIIEKQERERKEEEERLKKLAEEEARLRKLREEAENKKNQFASSAEVNVGGNVNVNDQRQVGDKNSPEQRKLEGNVLISFGGGSSDANNEQPNSSNGTDIDNSLKSSVLSNGSVSRFDEYRRHYLLSRGTSIPCVLITKIITDYKGLTTCQVTKDVYSVDGTVLLIERGSNVFGEQRTAMLHGRARVFTNWTMIRTKHGIDARIDSLGTDSLGAAGSEGWIDTHFKERFGGAIMLSFIQDAFSSLSNMSRKNSDVTYDNSSSAAEDMASEALKNSINIPPTAYVNQGDIIHIHVARDLDFSGVYDVNPY